MVHRCQSWVGLLLLSSLGKSTPLTQLVLSGRFQLKDLWAQRLKYTISQHSGLADHSCEQRFCKLITRHRSLPHHPNQVLLLPRCDREKARKAFSPHSHVGAPSIEDPNSWQRCQNHGCTTGIATMCLTNFKTVWFFYKNFTSNLLTYYLSEWLRGRCSHNTTHV